ncbi:MAG: CbiQ family ECF transporter T component [Alkalispirochaetaceae bacterium]
MDERLLFASYLLYQLLIVTSAPIPLIGVTLFTLALPYLLATSLASLLVPLKRFLILLLVLASIAPLTALFSRFSPLPALFDGLLLFARVLSLLLSAAVMLGVLSPAGVARVLRWACAPFGRPGETLSVITVAFFAILPNLEVLLDEQREARRLRGAAISGPLRRARYTLYPLLREGLQEAETLTDAFIARGFLLYPEGEGNRFRHCPGETLLPLALTAAVLVALLL